MTELKYNLLLNPAGICFNPISILRTIKSVINGNSLPEDELVYSNGLWCHHDFHGSFNNPYKKDCLNTINERIDNAHSFLKEVDRVIITIGTAYVYTLDGAVVNNCHKRPQSLFQKRRLSQSEIIDALQESISLIDDYSISDVEYILTLSPVRHLKDGMIENNISKSTCLLAIHELVTQFDHVHYFPAYEFIMDDLRDYRFYATDRVHPSSEAVDYVFAQFEKTHLYENDASLRKDINKIQQALAHRPFNPQSDQHIAFKKELVDKMTTLENNFGFLNFENEKKHLMA